MRKVSVGLAVLLFVAVTAFAQTRGMYLDAYIVKVKPDKRADFDAIARKIVDANRRYNGDTWLATRTEYGEQNTMSFVTPRNSFAEIEQGFHAFDAALNKAYGMAGAKKLEQDWESCLVSSRGEVWLRRWDLSNGPQDRASEMRLIGGSQWLRTMAVRVRPGKTPEFENMARMIRDAIVKANPKDVYLISQSIAGTEGSVFYITSLEPSLASFDTMDHPSMKEMLGEEGYQKYLSTVAETVQGSETMISRFVPEFSNVSEEIAAVAPGFWRPGPPSEAEAKR